MGASFDSPADNKAFADAEGFGYRLLSDRDRAVGTRYDVVRAPEDRSADFALRIAYLIDPGGVIRKAYQVTDVSTFADDVVTDLRNLQGATDA